MKKNERGDSYDPNLKFNILPLGEEQRKKDGNNNQVNLQIQRDLFDPNLKSPEERFGNQQSKHTEGDSKYSESEGKSSMSWKDNEDTEDKDKDKVKRYAPQPVPLDSKWLQNLPAKCPKQIERMQEKICCQTNGIDSTSLDRIEYQNTEEIIPQSESLDTLGDPEDTKSFVKSLLSDSDNVERRSYIRSLIPNVDDSTAAEQKNFFIKSLIVNPADLPESQRSTYASMKSSAVFDGDSSYALHYLEQMSPTSAHSIPVSIEDTSENQTARKDTPLITCEKELYWNKKMYGKHPPLIKQQQYNRFPGPQNPRRCSLRCPYKGNLEVRKEKLRCLLINEYLECENGLCIMGLGFISTQP